MLTKCRELILTTVTPTSAPITLVYIFISMHLLPVPITFRQSIGTTDDPTGHTPQFRALSFVNVCGPLALFASIQPICPSLLPFIIIKHDLAHRLGLHHHRLSFSLLWIGFSSISCICLSSLYHLHAKHSLPCKLHDCLGIYIYNPFLKKHSVSSQISFSSFLIFDRFSIDLHFF